jgi:hypothetical protein
VAKDSSNLMLYFAMVMATVFVAVFCVAFVKDMLDPDYDIPAALYPILTIIVGGIFGYVFKRSSDASG